MWTEILFTFTFLSVGKKNFDKLRLRDFSLKTICNMDLCQRSVVKRETHLSFSEAHCITYIMVPYETP